MGVCILAFYSTTVSFTALFSSPVFLVFVTHSAKLPCDEAFAFAFHVV